MYIKEKYFFHQVLFILYGLIFETSLTAIMIKVIIDILYGLYGAEYRK